MSPRPPVIAVALALLVVGCGGDDDAADDVAPSAVTPSADASEVVAPDPDTSGAGTSDAGSATADSLIGETAVEQFPSVVQVASTYNGDGTWNFAVTMTSPYDTAQRYADGWRVVGPDGSVYGTHTLAHDHANEQPFTRTQSNVEIPEDVGEVMIEGRDQVNGFGGTSQTVILVRD